MVFMLILSHRRNIFINSNLFRFSVLSSLLVLYNRIIISLRRRTGHLMPINNLLLHQWRSLMQIISCSFSHSNLIILKRILRLTRLLNKTSQRRNMKRRKLWVRRRRNPHNRLVLLRLNPFTRLDHSQIILRHPILLYRVLHRRMMLLVPQHDMIQQWALRR